MLFKHFSQLRFATYNKPTILQSLRSYKNSPAQSHLHDYIRSDQKLQQLKKQKIDYQFITKQSTGTLMFRQFLFQQKTQQTLVPHLDCELFPASAWTFDQIRKQLGNLQQSSKTQAQNQQILKQCESNIQKAIQQYYTNIGKKNYQFNLSEEINKINQMTDQEFRQFNNILHNKKNNHLQNNKSNQNIDNNQNISNAVRFQKNQRYDNKRNK